MHIVWSGGSRDAAMEMVEDFHARERERKRRRESCNSAFADEQTRHAQVNGRLYGKVGNDIRWGKVGA